MPLNAEQKKRMDKLDFSMGGGYSDFLTNMQKAEPSNSKVLFIGLGGKGGEIVAELKTQIHRKIKCPANRNKPDNFEYLAIDTDGKSLERLTAQTFGQIGLDNTPGNEETFSLFDSQLAKNLIEPDKRPIRIKKWMNPAFSKALQGEGAGAVRQAGRALLFGGKNLDLWNILEAKLDNLHGKMEDPENEKINVYIFTGIGGGTGSGTVIDIPYIIRKIIENNDWEAKINGYIFLPDTYETKKLHIDANSYAALQEIDSLMSLKYDRAGSFKAEYDSDIKKIVNSQDPVFDSCVLVSGKRNQAGTVTQPAKFSQRVVVDTIVNLVSDTKKADGTFLIDSFLDNYDVMVADAISKLPDEDIPKDKYFKYLAVGVGAVELPMDQMMAYLAKGTFDKMREGWNQHANENDVEQELNNLYTRPNMLGGKIINKSTTPLFSYSKGLMAALAPFKKIECIQDGTFFAEVQNLWMAHNVEMFHQWKKYRQICIAEVITTFDDRYKEMFQNPKYGIYYLKELLSWRVIDNQPFNGIRECINADYYAAMNELINGAKKAEDGARRKRLNLEKKGAFFFPYEEYCKTCVEELVDQDIQTLYDQYVRKCLDELILNIDKKIEELQAYIDIFTYLENIVTANYKTTMAGNMPHAEYTNVLLDFSKRDDDTSVKKVIAMLDNQLAQKTAAGLVTTLEGKMLVTRDAWIDSTEKFNPVKVFVEFLEGQFAGMANYTLSSFLQLKYNTGGLNDAISSMCRQLKTLAGVTFPAKTINISTNLPNNNCVVIPAGDDIVSDGVASFATIAGAKVATTSDRNRIYWYNLITGIPLYALKDILGYEQIYKCKMESKDIGLHLFETEETDWRRELPLLESKENWGDYHDTNEEKKENAIREQTKKYLSIGLIQAIKKTDSEDIDQYLAYGFDDKTLINNKRIVEWCKNDYLQNPVYTEDGLLDSGIEFIKTLRKNLPSGLNMPEFYIQNGNMLFNIDNKAALCKAMYLQSFLYKRLQGTYEICKKCIDMIEAKNAELREAKAQKVNLECFANYMKRGIIRTDDQAAFYVDSEGKQGVLLYYNMISPSMKLPFKTYYVFEKFSKLDAELKANLAQYYESLLVQENEDASLRAEFAKNNDLMKADIQQAQTILNQYTTRKNFADIGEGDLPDKYDEFYRKMALLS